MSVRSIGLDALAVLAPTECSGCGTPDRAFCDACRAALIAPPHSTRIGGEHPLLVWSALDYGGVVRRAILAFKDGGRTDAASALAIPLRVAIAAALGATAGRAEPAGTIRLATVPSTRAAFRRRGYHPVELVLARAGLRSFRPLRNRRSTQDQIGLGREQRSRNRAGSLRAVPQVRGAPYLLVDDVLTTGATLLEARRAIEDGGGTVIGAATIAHTRRK